MIKPLKNKIVRSVKTCLNRFKSPQSVFSEIYKNKSWSGAVEAKNVDSFCSGAGSSLEEVVDSYIFDIKNFLTNNDIKTEICVDMGCGDFRVGRRLREICGKYIGVDVVPELIQYNNKNYSDRNTIFLCLDIISDDLPKGDICIVRQVFQHLSNAQIKKALNNLSHFKHVIITEHLPNDSEVVRKNIDKVQGLDIRYDRGSGVFLDSGPFNIPTDKQTVVSKIPLTHPKRGTAWGYLQTIDYRP